MAIAGSRGLIRVHSSIAYRLGSWEFDVVPQTNGDRPCSGKAQVQFLDQFWSTQEPFELCLQMGEEAWWCWPRVSVRRNGSDVVFSMTGIPMVREYMR